MNKISFGKFIPTDSFLHKTDPRTKLTMLIASIVFVFLCKNYISLLLMTVFTAALAVISKVRVRMYLSNMKPILPIVIITSVLSAVYVRTGTVLLSSVVVGACIRIFAGVNVLAVKTLIGLFAG